MRNGRGGRGEESERCIPRSAGLLQALTPLQILIRRLWKWRFLYVRICILSPCSVRPGEVQSLGMGSLKGMGAAAGGGEGT